MQTKPELSCFPFQPTPVDSSLQQPCQNAHLSSVHTDVYKAFHLLRRSSAARQFMLGPSTPSSDLTLLTTPHPSFTISTNEVQRGKIPGQIALRYLGIPVFADVEGLSGGLVVTSYASRTHPMHDPEVMADVRVGRYVRDNETGEWCIITRNSRDQIVRLQYIRVTPEGARERIGLTCLTGLFDRGLFLESVLFKCQDFEWRTCHICSSSLCLCRSSTMPLSLPLKLETVAQTVMREGADEWVGTVRVTVIRNFSKNPLLNIDATMAVHSSYKPALDQDLVHHMRRLAIMETVHQNISVPAPISSNKLESSKSEISLNDDGIPTPDSLDLGLTPQLSAIVANFIDPDTKSAIPPVSEVPPLAYFDSSDDSLSFDSALFALEQSAQQNNEFPEWTFDDVFGQEGDEIADHFLIPSESPIRFSNEEDVDCPMQPADPSTLPGGVNGCLEGMEFGELEDEDDCFSLMTSDRDTRSESSALSVAGSDDAPLVDSVPAPGDDVVDLISSLKLSPSLAVDTCSHSKSVSPLESEDSVRDDEILSKPNVQCMSPINAPMSDETTFNHKAYEISDFVKEEANIFSESPSTEDKTKPEEKEDEESACSSTLGKGTLQCEVPRSNLTESNKQGVSTSSSSMGTPISGGDVGAAPAIPGMTPTLLPAMSHSGGLWIPFVGIGVAGHARPAHLGASTIGIERNDFVNKTQPPLPGGRSAQAPRLAPRPAGTDGGLLWSMNMPGNPFVMAARLEAIEKERKAEERRKKNRQAAARSNARKKDLMDGIRLEIQKSRQRENELRLKQNALRVENGNLKSRLNCNRDSNC